MKKIKILYVYGLGGSSHSSKAKYLRQQLPEYQIDCIEYPQYDANKAYRTLENYILKNNIDIVVGTSLGGFLTKFLYASHLYRIIVNPAMRGGYDIETLKLTDEQKKYVPSYKEYQNVFNVFGDKSQLKFIKNRTYLYYADNDQYFGKYHYEKLTSEISSNDYVIMKNAEHYVSKNDLDNYIIPKIKEIAEKITNKN